jgi:ATP-dependent DNA helicase RecG
LNDSSITASEALFLCNRKEGDLFDRKAARISGRKLEKAAVAFANADGGEIVVGIADDKSESDPNKRWNGAEDHEFYNPLLQCLFELSPALEFRHEFLSCDDFPGVVLRIFIQRSADVSKTSEGVVYQRKGASSLPVKDPAKITSLSFAKGATSFESVPLPEVSPEEIVDSSEMKHFCADLSPAQEPLVYCTNERLLDRDSFHPNCAGVLLFSDAPQPIFPRRCAVKVIFYDTKQEVPEREHLKKNISIEGPLCQQIHASVECVTKIMSSISLNTPDGLKKVDYPPEAVWEVVANAVIHRDYSISDDVQVTIFQNRIEVKSPGRLPGFVTVENFLDVRYSRNSKIVRTLARYKNAPNKDLGEGLNTAFDKMKEWKLQSPELIEEGNYVVVTLPHTPLASPEELVLEFLENHDEIRNRDAREITGIRSENQMKDVFYRLRDKGLIERVPNKQGNAAAWQRV